MENVLKQNFSPALSNWQKEFRLNVSPPQTHLLKMRTCLKVFCFVLLFGSTRI
jgi:hypothetical protein